MKKLISMLLAVIMTLALCACGGTAASVQETNTDAANDAAEEEKVDEAVSEISAADWLSEPITIIDNERIKIDLVDYDPGYSMGLLFTMCVTKKTAAEFSDIDCVIDDCTVILLSNQAVYADRESCHEMMYSDSMKYKQLWGSCCDKMTQGEQGYIALLAPIDIVKSSSISQPQSVSFYVTWNDYTADTYTVDRTDALSIPQDYATIELSGDIQNFEPIMLFEDDSYSAKIVSVKHNADADDYKFLWNSNNGNLGTAIVVCYENKTEHGTIFSVNLQEIDGQPAAGALFPQLYMFGDGRSCANTKMYVTYFILNDGSLAISDGGSLSKISGLVTAVKTMGETCATSVSTEEKSYNFEADLS